MLWFVSQQKMKRTDITVGMTKSKEDVELFFVVFGLIYLESRLEIYVGCRFVFSKERN